MNIHCLAIGADQNNRLELERSFQAFDDEFQVTFSDSVLDAIMNLDLSIFSLIISESIDIDTADSNLIQFLTVNHFHIPVLFIGKKQLLGHESTYNSHLFAGMVETPITPAKLAGKILVALEEKFFQGRMSGIDFISILQLVELDKLTCTLALFHFDHDDEGYIFFKEGRPVDAQFGKLQTDMAIQEMFSLSDVDIKMYGACPVMRDRLQTNCSKMIMDNKGSQPGAQTPKKDAAKSATTGLAGLFMKVKKNK